MARCDSKPSNAGHTPESRRRDSAARSCPLVLSRTCSSSCATSSMAAPTGWTYTIATTTPAESVPIRVLARLCESRGWRHSSTTTEEASASSRHWRRSVGDRSQPSSTTPRSVGLTTSRQGQGGMRTGAENRRFEEAEAFPTIAQTIPSRSTPVSPVAGRSARAYRANGSTVSARCDAAEPGISPEPKR